MKEKRLVRAIGATLALSACQSAVKASTINTFDYTGAAQVSVAPSTDTYRISAIGGQGGSSRGEFGAENAGDFTLTSGGSGSAARGLSANLPTAGLNGTNGEELGRAGGSVYLAGLSVGGGNGGFSGGGGPVTGGGGGGGFLILSGALAGTRALALVGFGAALAGERRRRRA